MRPAFLTVMLKVKGSTLMPSAGQSNLTGHAEVGVRVMPEDRKLGARVRVRVRVAHLTRVRVGVRVRVAHLTVPSFDGTHPL